MINLPGWFETIANVSDGIHTDVSESTNFSRSILRDADNFHYRSIESFAMQIDIPAGDETDRFKISDQVADITDLGPAIMQGSDQHKYAIVDCLRGLLES